MTGACGAGGDLHRRCAVGKVNLANKVDDGKDGGHRGAPGGQERLNEMAFKSRNRL